MKTCVRCGKEYTKLKKHLKNIKECSPIYLNISRNLLLKNFKSYDDHLKDFAVYKYKKDNNIIDHYYECEFCGKKYSHKTTYYKHRKHNCPQLNNLINDTTTKNKHIINNINNININNVSNITNFGMEKILDTKNIAKILNGPINKILSEYVRHLYVEIPENRNVLITNIRGQFAQVYINDKWECKLLVPVIDIMINKSSNKIMFYISECDKQIIKDGKKIDTTQGTKINIKNYLYNIKDNSKKRKIIKNEIISELINGRDKILETKKYIRNNIINYLIR